jgi:hypothetical protein
MNSEFAFFSSNRKSRLSMANERGILKAYAIKFYTEIERLLFSGESLKRAAGHVYK